MSTNHNLREVCAIGGFYKSIAVYEGENGDITLAGIKDNILSLHKLNEEGQLSNRQISQMGKYRFGNQAVVSFDKDGTVVVFDGQFPAKIHYFNLDGKHIDSCKPCIQDFRNVNSFKMWNEKFFIAESEKVVILNADGSFSHDICVSGSAMNVDIRDNQYMYVTDSKSNIHIYPIDSSGRISPGKVGYCMIMEDYPLSMALRGPEIWMAHGQKKYISVSS